MSREPYPHLTPLRRSSDPDRQLEQRVSGYSTYAQVRPLRKQRTHSTLLAFWQSALSGHYTSRPHSSNSASALAGAMGNPSSSSSAGQPTYPYTVDPSHISQTSPPTSASFVQYPQGMVSHGNHATGSGPEDLSPPSTQATGMAAAYDPQYAQYYNHFGGGTTL
jgi:hypothetical protein